MSINIGSNEFSNTLTKMLASQEGMNAAMALQGDDALTLVDILDQVGGLGALEGRHQPGIIFLPEIQFQFCGDKMMPGWLCQHSNWDMPLIVLVGLSNSGCGAQPPEEVCLHPPGSL